MRKQVEQYYPYAVSVGALLILAFTNSFGKKMPEFVQEIANNSLSMTVTLIGFFLTILTLINSLESNRMKHVKERGLMPRLLNYLKVAINANLVLLLSAFLIKYIPHQNFSNLRGRNVVDFFFLLAFLITVLLSFRFISIFVLLMADPGKAEAEVSSTATQGDSSTPITEIP